MVLVLQRILIAERISWFGRVERTSVLWTHKVAAVVLVVAVGGTGGVVGAATEIGGEEAGGDCERRVERMERSVLIDLGLVWEGVCFFEKGSVFF